jgi:hypothetical protein
MRKIATLAAIAALILGANALAGEGKGGKGGKGGRHGRGGKGGGGRMAGLRQKLLEKFDKDGDGKLSEEERAAMRKAFEERHKERRPERKAEK